MTLGLFDLLDMTGVNLFNTDTDSGWHNTNGAELGSLVAKHQLAITGGATDRVEIDTNVWSKVVNTSVSDGTVNYDVWNHNSAAAQLLIQQNVSVI